MRPCGEPGHARRVHDGAAFPVVAHLHNGRFRAVEDAHEIDLEDSAKVFDRYVMESCARRHDARVVDGDVDAAELRSESGIGRLHRVVVCDVDDDGDNVEKRGCSTLAFACRIAQRPHGRVGGVVIMVDDGDRRHAFGYEPPSDR